MLATVQRVSSAEVFVDGQTFSSIGNGCLVFLCIEAGDSSKQMKEMIEKIINFKMFDGPKGITSKSLKDADEEVLIVSQFTLAAITNKGTKPSFHKAATPNKAKKIYDQFVQIFKDSSLNVQTGRFGEIMNITLTNKGPITFNFRT